MRLALPRGIEPLSPALKAPDELRLPPSTT